jgi:ABC-type multidrug transport system fused ATPase/permease subunit
LAAENKLIRLLTLFRPELLSQRRAASAALALVLLQVGVELLAPWPLKVIVDQVVRGRAAKGFWGALLGPLAGSRTALLWSMLAAMVLLAVANALLEFLAQAKLVRIGQQILFAIRRRTYGHLQRLSFAFHTRQQVGDLSARVTSDINSLQDLFTTGARNLVTNTLLLAGMLSVMALMDWRFTLAALAVVPGLAWLVLRFKPKVKNAARAAKKREKEMASLAQETLVSFRLVQACAAEEFEDRRFENQGSQAMRARVEAGVLQARFAPAVDLVLAAGTALTVGLAVHGEEISVGMLLVLLAYLKSMYAPIKQLAKGAGQLSGASIASELVVELLETDDAVRDRPGARPAPKLAGRVELDRVSYAYPGGRAALHEVSLTLEPGEHCVIVGSTGAGKSTLVSLLPRFVDPDQGAVRLDGVDVREWTLRSLREQIAIVLQDAMLFRMSVRENIAYAREGATLEEIVAAAQAAHAHEFIVQLPQGYDTPLDERGGNLSGGQRQRLTLARAFLRRAPLLILDEPTTGLDLASERLVLQALEELTRGRTTVTIAHRLSTIERADKVVLLDAGRVADVGTHAQLLRRNPSYQALYRLQLAEPPPEPSPAASSG